MASHSPRVMTAIVHFLEYSVSSCIKKLELVKSEDQHTRLRGDNSSRVHEPNLCVAQRVCLSCLSDEIIENECEVCGQREFVFPDDPVGNLVKLAINSKFEKIICIAHNARGFDSQFILRYLIEDQKTQMPTLIMRGTKIISMRVGKICFLDSLNYLPMSLSPLPKAFGFDDIVTKGTFPHLFNTPGNQNYIGSLPALHFYSPDKMFTAERKRFMAWYQETSDSGYIFNFAEEFLRYCRDDVSVLRRACLAFRKLFIQCGKVCPFAESCTIASACSLVYRKNFLPADKIALLPPGGYRWADKQSRKAVSWLVWLERENGIIITHAGRTREQRLPLGLPPVDGYYEENNIRHVLQFHGCYWHGCKRCFRINRDKRMRCDDTMDQRYERTVTISARIKEQGFLLTEIWECEYDAMLKNNDEMAEFVKNHPMVISEPLEPREAFFGGRTENFVNMYEVKESEKIKYVDVCSLYPWVCKTGKFPIGHPKVYVGEECRVLIGQNNSLERVEGLVKCTVLPPRDLYFPVLPFRAHGKLLFALCKSCCLNLDTNGNCEHVNPEDRAFNGTWVVDELRKASSLGYTVLHVDEIWQYEITRYDPLTRSGGLFADYINTFLKIKQEASGAPTNCVGNPEALQQYIDDYKNAEGVELDANAIDFNPGLRSLAKLALNSFWGKFGQRENQTNTLIISTRVELMDLLTSPEIEITGILPVNHRIMYVNYKNADEAIRPSLTANVVIAAYTTAQARLKLYEYLEGLGRRVLYCDTDSCIYVSHERSDEYQPPVGQFLGDLTDELSAYGDGSYITSFVSGGPKFYSFIARKPDGTTIEVCKVKGITLNFQNSQQINYQTIRSFVTGERSAPIVLKFDAIRRTEFHHVISREETKSCAPVSVKRQQDREYCTLPYGFVRTTA
ncbi:uncharacterized protein [Venturia canescens]|uniref:uncharacterized protein n=1 Tax=Venturia canescens TaxID=32260 RepID=UPI001C9BCC17|nr:uncharacterized protein LOC122416752 [Venturia canescens]